MTPSTKLSCIATFLLTACALVIVFVVTFFASTNFSHAQSLRFEQLVKDTVNSNNFTQYFSCADLPPQIDSVTLSLSGYYYADIPLKIQFRGYPTYSAAGGVSEIAYTGLRNEQKDVTFVFDNPIDVEGGLCAGRDAVLMDILAQNDAPDAPPHLTFNVYGSNDNPYPGGKIWNGGGLEDMYFIINPHTQNNSAPGFDLSDQSVQEGNNLTFGATATDLDDDTLIYDVTGLPTGATFSTSTGEFSWTPTYDDAGVYEVVFTATEDTPEALFDTATVTITVNNVNRAPVMAPIGNQTVNEGSTLSFNVSATDPDGDIITLAAANLPTSATFDSNTGTFTWNTDYNDAGNYTDIEFSATDDGTPMALDVELITITVGNVNRSPVLTNPGPQSILETEPLSFSVSATDLDGDGVALSASGTPAGATFNPNTGQFDWTPDLSQAGVYTVTLVGTDNGLPVETGTIDVVITVGDNPTPTEQTQYLIDDVVTLEVPQNVENSYMANLQKVEQFILDGKINAALNQLQAFINKIGQDLQRGLLTQGEYDHLLAAAENLITDLTAN